MDFFKFFHFGLKRKYKYLLFGVVVALLVFNLLSIFGYCSSVEIEKDYTKYISSNIIIDSDVADRGICYYYCPTSGVITIKNIRGTTRYYFVSDSIETGVSVTTVGSLTGGETATYQVNEPCYILTNFTNDNIPITIDFVSSNSMSNTMEKLVTSVNSDSMWSIFNNSISYVAVSILVGIGFWFVIRLVDLVSKKGNR